MFIGYRAWERSGATPSYAFGHGLGYTDWTYEAIEVRDAGATAVVRVRNSGSGRDARSSRSIWRPNRPTPPARPAGWPASRASRRHPARASRSPSPLPRRAFEIWDENADAWAHRPGAYEVEAGRSVEDRRVSARVEV